MPNKVLKFKKKEGFTDEEWNKGLQYIIDNYAKDLENGEYKYVIEELSKLKAKTPFIVLLQLFQEENIPYELNEIPEYTFRWTNITEVEIPDHVKKIGKHAFAWCESLQSITLPDNLEEINSFTFFRCGELQSINIPNNVKEISNDAFADCHSLKSINISNSVEKISNYAFDNCSNLVIHTKNPYVIKYCKENDLKYDKKI